MISRIVSLFILVLLISACGPVETNVTYELSDIRDSTRVPIPDTSNKYIYDFMQIVVADQKLDRTYGLSLEPEPGCDLTENDPEFLNTLLKGKDKPGNDTSGWMTVTPALPRCLTKADVQDMLHQKETLNEFKWDNSRLGFSEHNENNWYCFSRPLFSKDKKHAVMMIRDLCRGLCGTGWTVLFTKENNQWTSTRGRGWIH